MNVQPRSELAREEVNAVGLPSRASRRNISGYHLVPLLLACGILVAACGTNSSNESASQYIYDAAITAKVKAALAAAPQLNAMNTRVETANGVVTLTGVVKSASDKARAAKVASEVSAVRSVQNNLEVEGQPSGPLPTPSAH